MPLLAVSDETVEQIRRWQQDRRRFVRQLDDRGEFAGADSDGPDAQEAARLAFSHHSAERARADLDVAPAALLADLEVVNPAGGDLWMR